MELRIWFWSRSSQKKKHFDFIFPRYLKKNSQIKNREPGFGFGFGSSFQNSNPVPVQFSLTGTHNSNPPN
jgi:hypothetical protein